MEFVQKFTPPDFQAKNSTLSISPDFNSFSGKKTQKTRPSKLCVTHQMNHKRRNFLAVPYQMINY